LADCLARILPCRARQSLGSAIYSPAQLKTMQEVITLSVFAAFSVLYLHEPFTWNYAIGFLLIAAGAYFIFAGPFAR